ncbi:MAG: ACT domain-containing protein [Clostridiales bacterium]
MLVKQLSVFVQNISGRLADITSFLAKNNVNLRAISMADTTDFGILRLIVDYPEESAELLKKHDYTVSVTEILAVEFPDIPGSLSQVLSMLNEEKIGIEYIYAFTCDIDGKACVILKPTDLDKAEKLLENHSDVRLFQPEEIYKF